MMKKLVEVKITSDKNDFQLELLLLKKKCKIL